MGYSLIIIHAKTTFVAHRTLIVRNLKGLQDVISVMVVHPTMDDIGWVFPETVDEFPGAQPDTLYGAKLIRDIYLRADETYEGRYNVPILWDKKTETIVNNESRYLKSSTR
jgi:glutathionyl-hydroquinone reductase